MYSILFSISLKLLSALFHLRLELGLSKRIKDSVAFVLVFVCMTMGIMNLPLMILQSLGGTEKQVGIAYSVAPFFELPFLLLFGLAAARGSKPGPMIRLGVIIGVAYYLLLSRVRGAAHLGGEHQMLGEPHGLVAEPVRGEGALDEERRVEATERDTELHGSLLRGQAWVV